MKRLQFTTDINASKERVWETLWNDATYREWTSAFSEGSYAISDWNEGSKILFLAPNGEGMHSIIDKKIPNSHMAFKHMGTVKDNIEQPADEKSKEWEGSMEVYNLAEENGITHLTVELDATEEYAGHFENMFPKALDNVKRIAESNR